MSSSLATLSSHCSTELHSLLANITSLQERVVGVEEKQVVGVEGGQAFRVVRVDRFLEGFQAGPLRTILHGFWQ